MALNRAYQLTMDLKHLKSLEAAQDLQHEGFWSSESEDLDQRVQNYSQDHQRLNTLWQTALADASNPDLSAEESFTQLCSHLKLPETDPTPIPYPITWRFNMIPYGDGEPATQTFPVPPHEEPHRAFALNFTYNNLSYDWGDYINRRDNKTALLRPSRVMFTDVYLPPTK